MKRVAAVLALLLLAMSPIATNEGDKEDKDKEDKIYQKATNALDAERWTAAVAGFRQIAEAKGPRADRALYWMAHAQFRGGRPADALGTLQDLRSRYPKSQWIDDAEAMEVEIRNSGGQSVAPESINDEELKLIAITSLMGSDPERANALIEKILAKKSSAAVKEKALFVLGQLGSAQAQKSLEGYARNGADREMQRYAIRAIAISGGGRGSLLADIYKSASPEIKDAILDAYMITSDHARLLQVAESEPNPRLRGQAVQKLGAMGATEELQRLYAKETSPEVKDSIIQGFFISGDVETLSRLARTEPDVRLRRKAIQGLGLVGGKRAYDVLMQIWGSDDAAEAKEAVIDALFIRGDSKPLIALARKETDRNLRRQLVQRIALMQDKEAREYMLELLDK
jgi:HEAT repeat protein